MDKTEVIKINKINPVSTTDTYKKFTECGKIMKPFLHRTTCSTTECIVKNCKNKTNNSCYICMACHPIEKNDNFPCSVRGNTPYDPLFFNYI